MQKITYARGSPIFLKIGGQLEAHLGNLHGKVDLAIWQLCLLMP